MFISLLINVVFSRHVFFRVDTQQWKTMLTGFGLMFLQATAADGTVFMYTQTEQSLTGRKNRGL